MVTTKQHAPTMAQMCQEERNGRTMRGRRPGRRSRPERGSGRGPIFDSGVNVPGGGGRRRLRGGLGPLERPLEGGGKGGGVAPEPPGGFSDGMVGIDSSDGSPGIDEGTDPWFFGPPVLPAPPAARSSLGIS